MEANSISNIDETEINSVSPWASKNTPFATILKLKEKYPNISAKNLGKLVGISKQAVCQMFIRHGVDFTTGEVVALNEYKVNRADIMAIKQIECMNAIDHRKLKKASARDLAIVFGTLYDKERLERGLSTSNQAVIYASAIESAFSKSNPKQGIEPIAQDAEYTEVTSGSMDDLPPNIPPYDHVCQVEDKDQPSAESAGQVEKKRRGRPAKKVGGGVGAGS